MNKSVVLKINIFFPLISDLDFEKYPVEQRSVIIKEIQRVLKLNGLFNDEFIKNHNIELTIDKDQPAKKIQNPNKRLLHGLQEKCLHFAITTEVDIEEFTKNLILLNPQLKIKPNDVAELLLHHLAESFGDLLFEILVLSQIARPGSLKLRDGIIWINEQKHSKTIPQIINLREPFEYAIKRGYPPIKFLDFFDYYNWLKRYDLIFNDINENAYQKAINQFSHLSGETNIEYSIPHMTAALEQLYANSIYQIADQLDQKIQVYLGTIQSHKKQIKAMYNIRSRYLHGDLPITALHKGSYSEISQYQIELEETYYSSVLLTIATLQKMYLDGRTKLSFQYQLVD